jgi:hypothetical protein
MSSQKLVEVQLRAPCHGELTTVRPGARSTRPTRFSNRPSVALAAPVLVIALLTGFLMVGTAQAQQASLSGRVVDLDGRGVAGAVVSLLAAGGQQAAHNETAADGRFTLKDLRPGPYTVKVTVTGFEPFTKTLSVEGATTLEVALRVASFTDTVIVTSRQDSLLGVADSAGQGVTGAADLADRPILRSGEILETVPGVIITQHAGGGKANQYFLRGFNLDHGTDFALFLDNMPLNLPSHAHGEGYSDMNVVIPELVETVDYDKGPYAAEVGNFGATGSAHLRFFQTLPADFLTVEGGQDTFGRIAGGLSRAVGDCHLLVGGEASYDDGPWTHPDRYAKFNGLVTYSQGDAEDGLSVTARGYHGTWDSSDQIPASFGVEHPFGTVDPTDGGNSYRFSLQGEWHRVDAESATSVMLYGFRYHLDLFSDFTYFLTDHQLGDQFEQLDNRTVAGLDAHHTVFSEWWGRRVENTVGLQVRNDWIDNGLYQTADRVRVNKVDASTGTILPATTEADDLTDLEAGIYAENRVKWFDTLRTIASLRGDIDFFDVTSLVTAANSGTSTTVLPSPKLKVILGPWSQTEVYASGGFGFHSNDARGATQTVEPISAENPFAGAPAERIPGLIQTKGAELGVRTLAIPHLQSTVSVWYLHSDSELQQDGDTGGTVASKEPSNRYGVEWANYLALSPHLALDLDLALSRARFSSIDADDAAPGSPGGTRVPEAVNAVLSSGLTFHEAGHLSGSLRLRYFGPRDLTSDGIYRSPNTLLLNAGVGYSISPRWSAKIEILNLLDRHDHDIDYAYTSQASPTSPAIFEDVFHPVEPLQVRLSLTARFPRSEGKPAG